MIFALLTGPLGKILFFSGLLSPIVPIMADRSRHRPGNVAPVQLISSIGAWALILLQAAMLVAAIRDGSPIVACASFATVLTIIVLFLRGDGGRIMRGETPEAIDEMVREIEQILGGARRTGIESVTAVTVAGAVPWIGVSVPRRGHIVVRVRQDLLPWLERHRRPPGAGKAAVGSLLRFTFLHELGHVLNGDHLTYRIVRSVLVAHLWWLAATAVACVMFPFDRSAASTALVASLCIAPPFFVQCRLARRFLAAREEDADLRAMQTLDPADASRLTARKPNGSGPTLLEKLVTDLHVQTPLGRPTLRPLAKAVQWIWPEAGRIHERSNLVADGRGGRPVQPRRWAAWMGMQCGLLAVAILTAFGTALPVSMIVMALICSMAATYCGLRVDPARVRLHDLKKVPERRAVGAIFYLCFSASALLLYLLPALSEAAPSLPYPLFTLAVIASAPQVFLGSFAASAIRQSGPEDAARALRHPVLRAAPAILISVGINIGCSMLAAWYFGVGWQGPAIVTFTGIIATITASRSTNASVRAVPPIAMLDSPGNIYSIRIFWRELYFDRGTTPDLVVGIIGVSTYTAMALLFASAAAFAAKAITVLASEEVVFESLLLMAAVLAGCDVLVRKRPGTTALLCDLEHLQMLESLLSAARTAGVSTMKLSEALAFWIRTDAALPRAVLPEPRLIWKLDLLLPLVRTARAVGEEASIARWRGQIADALRRIITNGAVTLNGARPSLGYTVLVAELIDEAGLTSELPIDPILDSIADQLEQWLNRRTEAAAGPVAAACRMLALHDRPQPGPERIRMRSLLGIEALLSRPIVRKAVSELAAYAKLLEHTEVQKHLAGLVRARLWETLILNPANDVPLLVDCYLTAVATGETNSPRLAAAELEIAKFTDHMADELMKMCRG